MGIKALLMTDDEHCIASLRTVLEARLPFFEILHLCPVPLSAVQIASYHDPDVLIIDEQVGGPVISGIIMELSRELTPTRYILLTMNDDEAAAERARLWGTADYLPRAMGTDDLLRCFREMVRPDEVADRTAESVPAACLAHPSA
ncbi:MAG: hypothetical protein ACQERR_10075 [Pseudomonadota bacterium]